LKVSAQEADCQRTAALAHMVAESQTDAEATVKSRQPSDQRTQADQTA
jgi:hypothetical protein